ncbi:GTP-binding protein [Paramagnetospirillum magneticum]|uniref:Flagellar biosynthesis protein FlhF n=1 Tax=Paramagnetospirillum magneticum (strain ATCC 700264 / AMB-1) TaxID=342108 RepID=Q2WA24_PARM1|nr:GTP-binding protein [Paramagnetospirillum magneticum]BAE49301.1 Flagellar GTP-binding protein [Paramagnetospirillum magneticum AMB-1]
MRLKSFTAPTMAEAMELVRQELGDDAIIVSTQRAAGSKGVRITAALESVDADLAVASMLEEATGGSEVSEAVRKALVDHGVPSKLVERLVNAAHTSGLSQPPLACAAALEAGFTFAHLPEHGAPRPFMLVGPNGSGKSIAAAKLAARSVLKQRQVGVITCDNIRAGAVEQLAAFTSILEIDLVRARGPESLARVVESVNGAFDLVVIDSPGLNPFKQSDMDYLQALIEAADVEPVLVMAAGGDPEEAAEIGEAFAAIGATRLFASRLDTTRRLGSILAAAEGGQMAFCDVSASPHVASGISPISAVALARLIMPQSAEAEPKDETFWTEASAS